MSTFERYLTVWVGLCIVVGIALGQLLPGPVQAIGKMEIAKVNLPVGLLIWVMIIPMLMKVDFGSLHEVRRHGRGIGVTLLVNWAIKPFSMALLGFVFIRHLFADWLPASNELPVCHVTWFEADAFARWSGARLPREDEWETASVGLPVVGNLVESRRFHPARADAPELGSAAAASSSQGPLRQMFGDVWEWTSSAYSAYPGLRPAEGAIGEYNGKFMCGQFVLKGGSCATPATHIRGTYRNFFPPEAAWQFTGVRLAKDLE